MSWGESIQNISMLDEVKLYECLMSAGEISA